MHDWNEADRTGKSVRGPALTSNQNRQLSFPQPVTKPSWHKACLRVSLRSGRLGCSVIHTDPASLDTASPEKGSRNRFSARLLQCGEQPWAGAGAWGSSPASVTNWPSLFPSRVNRTGWTYCVFFPSDILQICEALNSTSSS